MAQNGTSRKLTVVSTFHYFRLFYRTLLFFLLLISYIRLRVNQKTDFAEELEQRPMIVIVLMRPRMNTLKNNVINKLFRLFNILIAIRKRFGFYHDPDNRLGAALS